MAMIINSLVDSIVILNKSNNYGIGNKGEKKNILNVSLHIL